MSQKSEKPKTAKTVDEVEPEYLSHSLYTIMHGGREQTVIIRDLRPYMIQIEYQSGRKFTFRYSDDDWKLVIKNLMSQLNLDESSTVKDVLNKRIVAVITKNTMIPLPFSRKR